MVQRLASIAALFYLLTVLSYIKLRQPDLGYQRLIYGLLLVAGIIGGLHSKENFVAVFLLLFLWELFTAAEHIRRRLLSVSAGGVFALMLISPFVAEFWQALDKFSTGANALSRINYFYSQQLVLWDYVVRFVYPLNLQLDIDAAAKTAFEPVVALALAAHIAVIAGAWRLRKTLPLLFVGIVFFYASHSIESFIIPIEDLAFEHRTYIGNIGLVIAVVALIQTALLHGTKHWSKRGANKNPAYVVVATLCVLLLVLSVLTFTRNQLWQTPLAFYANEVRLAPGHARSNASYGTELMKAQRYAQAEPYLKKSVDINLALGKITASGLTAYMTVLYHQKKYQQAAPVVMIGLKYIKRKGERSTLLGNLAFGYIQMGFCDFAKGLLNRVIKINPQNHDARKNLDYCLTKLNPGG